MPPCWRAGAECAAEGAAEASLGGRNGERSRRGVVGACGGREAAEAIRASRTVRPEETGMAVRGTLGGGTWASSEGAPGSTGNMETSGVAGAAAGAGTGAGAEAAGG